MPKWNTAHREYAAPPRIKAALDSGQFHANFKLIGNHEIAWYLQWSPSKLGTRLQRLRDAGVIFSEDFGGAIRNVNCSYPELILRYLSLCAKNRVHV